MADEPWLAGRDMDEEMVAMTEAVERKLNAVGIPTRRPMELSLVGRFSGRSCGLVAHRHINFLPSVASGNRRQLIKRLAYYGGSRPHLRYLVLTNGKRCGIGELRSRLESLGRSISRIAADPDLRDTWSASIELRVSEFTVKRAFASPVDGSPVVRGKKGKLSPAGVPVGHISYHPHANVIVNCKRYLGAKGWQAFKDWMTSRAPGHWRDNGPLRDAQECVKYFVKPSEVLEHGYGEMRELFLATFGIRAVAPMSGFRDFTRSLVESRLKLGKVIDKDGVWRWCFIPLADSSAMADKRPPPDPDELFPLERPPRKVNHLLAWLPAQPRFTPRFEPVMLVANYTGDFSALLSDLDNDALEPARIAWQESLARTAPIPFTPSPQLSGNFPLQNGTQQRVGPRILTPAPT